MLSIGCGYHEDHTGISNRGLFWVEEFCNITMAAQQNNAHLNLVEKFGVKGIDRYMRLNPKLD